MRPAFLVDENLSPKVADFVRRQGFDGVAVRDVGLRGKKDREIFAWAKKNNRVVLTSDLDFGKLFLAQPGPGGGTILLRHFPKRTAALLRSLTSLVKRGLFTIPDLPNVLVVASPRGFRVRRRKKL